MITPSNEYTIKSTWDEMWADLKPLVSHRLNGARSPFRSTASIDLGPPAFMQRTQAVRRDFAKAGGPCKTHEAEIITCKWPEFRCAACDAPVHLDGGFTHYPDAYLIMRVRRLVGANIGQKGCGVDVIHIKCNNGKLCEAERCTKKEYAHLRGPEKGAQSKYWGKLEWRAVQCKAINVERFWRNANLFMAARGISITEPLRMDVFDESDDETDPPESPMEPLSPTPAPASSLHALLTPISLSKPVAPAAPSSSAPKPPAASASALSFMPKPTASCASPTSKPPAPKRPAPSSTPAPKRTATETTVAALAPAAAPVDESGDTEDDNDAPEAERDAAPVEADGAGGSLMTNSQFFRAMCMAPIDDDEKMATRIMARLGCEHSLRSTQMMMLCDVFHPAPDSAVMAVLVAYVMSSADTPAMRQNRLNQIVRKFS